MTDFEEKVFIQGDSYIYRVKHRIMEGDCEYDHGPRVEKEFSETLDRRKIQGRRQK